MKFVIQSGIKLAAWSVIALLGCTGACAGEIVKANITASLNLTNSWVGNVVPTSSDIAVYDSTITAARICTIGDNLAFAGIRVTNVLTGLQTIATTANSVLSLGPFGVDLSGATVDMTISCTLNVAADQAWSIGSGRTLTIAPGSGVSSTGLGNIIINGPGNLRLGNGTSWFGAGDVTLGGGLSIGSINATGRNIPSAVFLDGDIAIYNQAISTSLPSIQFSGGLHVGAANHTVTLTAIGLASGSAFVPNFAVKSPITGAGALILTNGSGGLNPLQSVLFGTGASVNTGLTLGAGISTLFSAVDLLNSSTRLQIDAGGVLQLSDALNTSAYKSITYSQTVGSLNGAGTITSEATSATEGRLTVDSTLTGVNSSFSGVISNAITAKLGLIKTGPNTLALSGVNAYSGSTTVSNGTLLVNSPGSLAAASAVTVMSGATLGGTGAINGVTTVSGRLAPGAGAIGQLNIANNVTWNGGASPSSATDWVFELGAGNTADFLNITGDFIKGTGSVFRFDFAGSTTTGTFKLVDWSGTTTFIPEDFSYVNLGGGHTATFQFNGSRLEVVISEFGTTAVSQFGITWRFSTNHLTGQYANGDWWVVGPVTITTITPASTSVSGWIKNGSQLNPPISETQGYDNSMDYMTYDAAKNVARPGGNALSAENPLLISSGSLVSTVSLSTTNNRPQLQTAAILTVVTSVPAAGSFRPPPVGSDKTSYWNKSNLNYSILKSLAPVTNTPALATVEGHFQKPWLEQNGEWTARYIHPLDNQPDYGRDMAHQLAEGLLSLHLNYSTAQKELLYVRLVQYGIDVYGAAKGGSVWRDLGGHNQGRKMPMILAGLALNDTNILAWANAANHFIFQEDRQTWYVTQYDVGRALYTGDGRPREQYIQADVGIPEWGEQHVSQENRDGRNWDAFYRDICYASGMGHALAAHLTTGAVAGWNWPAYFDYMDRAFGISGSGASLNVNTIQPYVADMWNAYRSSSSPPTIAVAPASPGQFAYTVCGSAGQTFVVQISGDLQSWLSLFTNTLAQSCVTLTNTMPVPATNRFYRAMLLP